MADDLVASLDLDYSEAIAGADGLADAIESAMQAGAAGGASAIVDELNGIDPGSIDVPITADASGIIEEINGIEPGEIEVPISADASNIVAEINAIEPGEIEVPVSADASNVVAEINAIEPGEIEVPVSADVSNAAEDIAGLDNVTVSIAVEADSSDAQADLDALAGSAEEASSSLGRAGGSAGEAGAGFGVAGEGASIAAGGLAKVSGSSLSAAAGIGVATFGFGELFREGVTAATGTERLSQAAGTLASSVQQIHVGNLNTDLRTLGNEFGSTGAEMDAAAAKAINFATAGGYSSQQSVTFAQNIAALSARAVALNPSLGNVADVADQMSTSFGRVILAAKKYNLSLSTAEVAQRAMANTGKVAANQLTIQDKAFAAVQISSERYGNTLAEKIAAGSELAANKQKSLIATGKELAETLGRPLAEGAISGLSALQGPVEAAIKGFSALPGPVQTAAAALIAFGIAEQLLGKEGAVAGTRNLLASLGEHMGLIAAAAVPAGIAIGTMGLAAGNTTQTVLGFTAAGAGLGFVLGGPVGAGIGAASGALIGFGAAIVGPTHHMSEFDLASRNVADAIKGHSTPAILAGITSLQAQSTNLARVKVDTDQVSDATKRHAGALGETRAGLISYVAEQLFAEESGKRFNQALRDSPGAALQFISAMQSAGRDVTLLSAAYDVNTQSSRLAAQAQAAAGAAAAPLKVSFEQAATAVGGLTARQFEVAGAGSQALDSMSKLGPATEKFNQAVSSGNAEQIEAAANARATAVAQDAYNQALLATGSATEAAKFASGAFRAELAGLADSLPAGPAKDAINGIIERMDALSATTATPKVTLEDGDAFARLQTIRTALQDQIEGHEHKAKVTLENGQALDSTGQIKAALEAIKQGADQGIVLRALAQSDSLDSFKLNLETLTGRKWDIHVDANTQEATANVRSLADIISNQRAVIEIDGNNDGAIDATNSAKVHADATTGKVTIDGDPALARSAVEGTKVYADTTTGKIIIGGDEAPANSKIIGVVQNANTSTGVITVDGNPAPALGQTSFAVQNANGARGIMTIDGNPDPATGKVNGVVTFADGSTGTVTVDGNPDPAKGQVTAAVTFADGSTGTVTVAGNPAQAHGAVGEAVDHANRSHGDIGIGGREEFKRGDYGVIGTATISVRAALEGPGSWGKFASGGKVPYGGAAAAGASFSGASIVTVGERGMENVLLPGGSFVENNPRTRARNQRDGDAGGTTEVTVDASALDAAANRLLGAAELLIAVTGLGDPPSRRILQARA